MANYQLSTINSQLPKGYKQTEVGVIPEDWEVKTLQEISEKITVGIASAATHAYRSRGIPLIRNQNIKPNQLDDSDILFISEEYEVRFKNKRLQEGDLLTARTGYPGTTCIVPEQFESAQSFTTLITRLRQGSIDSEFLSFFINSDIGQSFFDQNQIGGGQKNVNAGTLRELQVPVPSKEEQRAIATTLSDVDALIAALDRLIAKKRHIKTATMQQLLTGKRRLPGFGEGKGDRVTEIGVIPDDWELHPLGDITEYIKGFAFKSSDFQAHGVRVIRVSDTTFDCIKDDSEIFIDARRAKNFKKWSIKKGDLIISTVGSKPPMYDSMVGKATFVDTKNEGSLLNQNAVIIRSKDWSQEVQILLHNHLRQPRYIDYVEKIFRGNANQASITLKELFEFLIPMPEDSKEQRAIASILSDMDAEITALEARRTKTKAIKQGMMQELLTGRTRLIDNG